MVAVIFHYWLGVLLTLVAILAVVALVGGYIKKVYAPQFPPTPREPEE